MVALIAVILLVLIALAIAAEIRREKDKEARELAQWAQERRDAGSLED